VTSKASSDFWNCFEKLPPPLQRQARKQYQLFRKNPSHPSLQFKELRPGLVSVRVTRKVRALTHRHADAILWFWIGSHAEYDKLLG